MTIAIVLSAVSVLLVVALIVVVLTRPKPPSNEQTLSLMQQQMNGLAANSQALSMMQQHVESLRSQVNDSLAANTSLLTQQLGEVNRQVTQQMSEVTRQVNQQLGSLSQQMQGTNQNISERLDKAAQIIGGVQKGLGELSGSTQRILDVGKDIAQLQEILRAPKLRGGLGELFLGELIGQILPQEYYELQYRFKSGEVVDAIIRLGQGLVPVDAKFPLENFRKLQGATNDEECLSWRKAFLRDVKKHVDDVARKYILPDEGTFDFALMYIPAENVYYEIIIKEDSSEGEAVSAYALKKKVIPVSPNSFYAYLQAIVLGLKGLQIEKQARVIMDTLQALNLDFARFREEFKILGKHLTDARNKYEETEKRLVRLEDKLSGAATPAVEGKAQPQLPL
jgi:DNA recombination protein RmuC